MTNRLKKFQTDEELKHFCFINQIHIDNIDYINNIDLNKKGTYILNLDKSQEGGTHWVALIIKNCGFFYFDPFGFRCPLNIENFCKKNKKPLYYNLCQFQQLEESLCGFYCCLFLYIVQNIYGKLENKFDFYNIIEEYKFWDICFLK